MFGDILRRRQVRLVTWFHTDHWEPWGAGVNDKTLKRLESFRRQAKGSRFASKMTLFYLSGCQYRLRDETSPNKGAEDEILVEAPRSEHQNMLVRESIGQLQAYSDVEFQLHLHHESLVGNDGDWNPLHKKIKDRTNALMDEK